MKIVVSSFLLAAVTFTLAGCGGKSDGPALTTVSGTVLLDGKPLPAGKITFYPDDEKGTTGPSSSAIIGDNGEFELDNGRGEKGAIVGHHKVVVRCLDMYDTNSNASSEPGAASKSKKKAAKCKIPSIYDSLRSTTVTVEVKEGENTGVVIKLVSK